MKKEIFYFTFNDANLIYFKKKLLYLESCERKIRFLYRYIESRRSGLHTLEAIDKSHSFGSFKHIFDTTFTLFFYRILLKTL